MEKEGEASLQSGWEDVEVVEGDQIGFSVQMVHKGQMVHKLSKGT